MNPQHRPDPHARVEPGVRPEPPAPGKSVRRAPVAMAVTAIAAALMLLAVGCSHGSHHSGHSGPGQPATTTAAPGSPGSSASPSPASPTPNPAAEAADKLMTLLPPGFPPGTCKPVPALAGAVAELACGKNTDTGGPLSASYRMFVHPGALGLDFDTVVSSSDVVTCPGRIQSPGPWHRTATPDEPAGTLLCAVRQDRPTVAWTNDKALLFGMVQAGPDGPSLEQLFTWWGSHS